ncbi:GAP family protein [Nakamurella lactea]|uniref:GAP family protein n=1 Tax=Nakamurella lactea TaxID=459515 RepID=UPI0004132065|nr:GAP family protein [Nakamurella lactea]
MLTAIGQSMPVAAGLLLANVPMVIVALILVIRCSRAVITSFLIGWMLGLAGVAAVLIALADLVTLASQPAWWAGYLKIVLGAALIVLAVRKWLRRTPSGTEPTVPKWMAKLDGTTAAGGLRLGFLLAAVNPKNIVFLAAGAAIIADATPRVAEQAVAVVVFVLIASLGVAGPVIAQMSLGERAESALAAADQWLTRNTDVIMAVVLFLIGLMVAGNGLAEL